MSWFSRATHHLRPKFNLLLINSNLEFHCLRPVGSQVCRPIVSFVSPQCVAFISHFTFFLLFFVADTSSSHCSLSSMYLSAHSYSENQLTTFLFHMFHIQAMFGFGSRTACHLFICTRCTTWSWGNSRTAIRLAILKIRWPLSRISIIWAGKPQKLKIID